MKKLSSTGRILIIAILVLLAAASEVFADSTADIIRVLAESGLKEGLNADGTVVAVAHARGMVEDPSAASSLARRNALAVEAEMRARQEIITLLAKEMTGSRGVSSRAVGDLISNEVKSEFAAKAQLVMRGCGIIDSAEELGSKGGYKVSVAVAWKSKTARGAERVVAAQAPQLQTPVIGARVDEWKRWALNEKLDCKFGVRKFIGSDGLLRYAGLGFADIEDYPKGSPHLRAAQKIALDQARANLAIALSADTRSGESVLEMLAEDDGSSVSMQTSLSSKVDAVASDLTTNAPEVYATTGIDPLTGRRIYISVCGWEPWQLAKLIKRDEGPVKPYIPPVDPKSGSMKQWNPITSRFE